jgi:hypothetical protein
MHLALVLTASLAALAADERPEAANRKAARVHAEAAPVWARCLDIRERDASAEPGCLVDYLEAYEHARVKARGADWPANVPDVPAARDRLDSLLLDTEEARLQAEAAAAWDDLSGRLDTPGESEITELRAFIKTWEGAVAIAAEARRPIRVEALGPAQAQLPRVLLTARTVEMPAGPWDGQLAAAEGVIRAPGLHERSAKKNSVIDDARWFRDVDWTLPVVLHGPVSHRRRLPTLPGEQAARVPSNLDGQPLRMSIVDGELRIGVYGSGANRERLAVVDGETGELIRFFDFTAWTRAPGARRGDEQFVDQSVVWAQVRDDVLYVNHDHRTYAASSRGHNAYLSAIDLRSGQLLWRSVPLVCNSRNFVIDEDRIWCGYGFTAEPDFVTLLDRRTGALLSKTRVKTGPDYLLLRRDTLYVRTYDMDYVFELR